jgi:glycosyltransferase involved in cell wall biosynthesis
MRIGIDARELGAGATGVGRYLGGLLTEWAKSGGEKHQFVLYAPHPLEAFSGARHFTTRLVSGSGTWWEQMRLPSAANADGLDVFFAPAYSSPLLLRVPTVVAIHDLSFFAHPEWFRMREGLRRRWFTQQAAARARQVVTISDFTRRELVDRLGVPGSRIHVIPPGVGTMPPTLDGQMPEDRRRDGDRAGDRTSGGTDGRVLYVGSIFQRRHVVDLIRAFGRLARRRADVSLDIVGDNRSYPYEDIRDTIGAESLDGRVRWHQYVTDDTLHRLYGKARAFAFLSEYEGLGLTPLEALAAGVPPVLLDTAVARESCRDAALYVPAGDLAATTAALELALFDEKTRARLLAAAPATLDRYSWPRAARETLAVLERAAHRTDA